MKKDIRQVFHGGCPPRWLIGSLAFCFLALQDPASPCWREKEATEFIRAYTAQYAPLNHRSSLASWLAHTDMKPEHSAAETAAFRDKAAFTGAPWVRSALRRIEKNFPKLSPLTRRQLEVIRYKAAVSPAAFPSLHQRLNRLIAEQSVMIEHFPYRCPETGDPISPAEIRRRLESETNTEIRRRLWETVMAPGALLTDSLGATRDLRNELAKRSGYSSAFAMETANYGLTPREMLDLVLRLDEEIQPLYRELHSWVRGELAQRLHERTPDLLPAHWAPEPWSQNWSQLLPPPPPPHPPSGKSPEWLLQKAEAFFVSMGYPHLPSSFRDRSDLFAPREQREKNPFPSSWHIDLSRDVRAIMNLECSAEWIPALHHELGHIYYFLEYSRDEVPVLLRDGANRAFHEAAAGLFALAAVQPNHLRRLGAAGETGDPYALLRQALDNIVFIPWSAAVVQFEYDLYEKNLPPGEFQRRWRRYVRDRQGVIPPSSGEDGGCDIVLKIHIRESPGRYYDYAIAKVLMFQLHDAINREIKGKSLYDVSYYNSRTVGAFLNKFLRYGAAPGWRERLRRLAGADLNVHAMLKYFNPLRTYLEKEKKKRGAFVSRISAPVKGQQKEGAGNQPCGISHPYISLVPSGVKMD